MPARVHDRPEMVRMPSRSDNCHEHELQSQANKNLQHKDALVLRLALGSILAPKRSHTPSSRSSSGSASPAHPASFTPPPLPNLIPGHGADAGHADALLHPYFPHTPSRLGHSESRDHSPSISPPSPSSLQPNKSLGSSPPLIVSEPALSDHPHMSEGQVYAVRAPKPVSAPQPGTVDAVPKEGSGSGSGTPKAKFIETLQSKSAWDALIHGSFS